MNAPSGIKACFPCIFVSMYFGDIFEMKVSTTPLHIYIQIKKIQGYLPIDLKMVWSDRFSKWKHMVVYHAFHLLAFHIAATGMNEMYVCVCTFYIIHLHVLKDPLVKTTNVGSFVTIFFFLSTLYISVCVCVFIHVLYMCAWVFIYVCTYTQTYTFSTFDIHKILWHIWVKDDTNMINCCALPEENRTVWLHQTAVSHWNV